MPRYFVLSLLVTGLTWGQLSTGSIVGAVRGPSGLAVSGVAITAVHVETGQARQAATNERGDFTIGSLETHKFRSVPPVHAGLSAPLRRFGNFRVPREIREEGLPRWR